MPLLRLRMRRAYTHRDVNHTITHANTLVDQSSTCASGLVTVNHPGWDIEYQIG
jgi:hypothetical protein